MFEKITENHMFSNSQKIKFPILSEYCTHFCEPYELIINRVVCHYSYSRVYRIMHIHTHVFIAKAVAISWVNRFFKNVTSHVMKFMGAWILISSYYVRI